MKLFRFVFGLCFAVRLFSQSCVTFAGPVLTANGQAANMDRNYFANIGASETIVSPIRNATNMIVSSAFTLESLPANSFQ
jgi:hypothetical protein